MKKKLQKILDARVEDLTQYSDKSMEFLNLVSKLDETKTNLSEDEMEMLFNLRLINNVVTNKIISIFEFKYLMIELGIELNYDKFLEIPNVIEFEVTYKKFKEDQKFFKIVNGNIERDIELTKDNYEIYKEEIKKLEGN